jgi:S-adenosylmethionine:tRNA ribosyltransferase-isomerase
VAAPTAGLHFTEALLSALEQQGVRHAAVTLHVGPGTFKPVTVAEVEQHRMDAERYTVPEVTARLIRETRAAKGRIVAVGSTVVRTLETVAADHESVVEHDSVVASQGRSDLFIYPPYKFHVVDALLTNFHLPSSSLLMMVSALAGRELILRAYAEAIRERYRFYSYGDCMLIV